MTTWIFDPGHEGESPGGLYLRQGKQSPAVPPGIYEGFFNRAICERLRFLCEESGIASVVTVPGPINVPLKARRQYADKLHKACGDCILISVHANAAGNGSAWQDRAQGVTAFTRPRGLLFRYPLAVRETQEKLAVCIVDKVATVCPLKARGVKTANFSILRVACPAVLVECGFMDHRDEAVYLASERGQKEIARSIFAAVHEFTDPL